MKKKALSLFLVTAMAVSMVGCGSKDAEENGWLYVESGNVRGFVKASEVYTGDAVAKTQTRTQKRKILKQQ